MFDLIPDLRCPLKLQGIGSLLHLLPQGLNLPPDVLKGQVFLFLLGSEGDRIVISLVDGLPYVKDALLDCLGRDTFIL